MVIIDIELRDVDAINDLWKIIGDASPITVGFFDNMTFDGGTERILIFPDELSFSSSVIVIYHSQIVGIIE